MCEIEENCFGVVPDFFYPPQYVGPSYKVLETDVALQNKRDDIDLNISMVGGGIDPTTGYTRSTMDQYPWLNFERPVDLQDLPDWTKFVAGLDSTHQNRAIYQAIVRQRNSDIRYGSQTYSIYIIVVVIIVILILTVLFFWWRGGQ